MQLIDANGLEMIKVAANGNCVFRSPVKSVKEANHLLTAASLREVVCNHMTEFSDEYMGFSKSGEFYTSVNKLAATGTWNINLADAVPLALSNLFQAKVLIFTSEQGKSLITVAPTLIDITHPHANQSTCLYFAYMAIPGQEHFNACIHKNPLALSIVPVFNWNKDNY